MQGDPTTGACWPSPPGQGLRRPAPGIRAITGTQAAITARNAFRPDRDAVHTGRLGVRDVRDSAWKYLMPPPLPI